ncbi:hypothetical protein BN1708_009474, partial [Verticillium longisporum]
PRNIENTFLPFCQQHPGRPLTLAENIRGTIIHGLLSLIPRFPCFLPSDAWTPGRLAMTNPFRAGSSGLHQIEHHRHSLQSSRQQAGCCHLPFVSAIRLWQPSSRRQPLGFQLLPSTGAQAVRIYQQINQAPILLHQAALQVFNLGRGIKRGLFDVSNHDTTGLKHAYAAFRDVQKPAFIFGKDALSTRVNPVESDGERVELAEFLVPRNLGIAPMYHLVELVLSKKSTSMTT